MVEPPENNHQTTSQILAFIFGFLEVLGINFLVLSFVPALFMFTNQAQGFASYLNLVAMVLILGIGLIQFIYVIPRAIWLYRRDKDSKLQGLLTAALIVLLLNGGCWLFAYTLMR